MAFKTRRQARYSKLRAAGFVPAEARALSKVPTRITPYWRMAVKARVSMKKKAQKMGHSEREFEEQIKELYRVNRWLKRNKAGKWILDPWAMFREEEDKWKAKFPQYESPWQKRWKDWQDFQRRIERTIAKQRGQA